jgi:hypothetical protein
MTDASDLRKYITIAEQSPRVALADDEPESFALLRELDDKIAKPLNEGELIAMRPNTLRVNVDDYTFLRTILQLPQPSHFTSPNHYGKIGILTFWDRHSYDEVKGKLQKFNISFKEEPDGMTTYWDKELTPETEQPMSPYPSNMGIRDPNEAAPATPAKKKKKRAASWRPPTRR